jgi:hypothetical protein
MLTVPNVTTIRILPYVGPYFCTWRTGGFSDHEPLLEISTIVTVAAIVLLDDETLQAEEFREDLWKSRGCIAFDLL